MNHGSETQLQVGENLKLMTWRTYIIKNHQQTNAQQICKLNVKCDNSNLSVSRNVFTYFTFHYFSNSVGPLVSIWMTTSTGHVSEDGTTPRWLLLYGGVGITIGLWLWGRRVIETVGKDIVQISPSR